MKRMPGIRCEPPRKSWRLNSLYASVHSGRQREQMPDTFFLKRPVKGLQFKISIKFPHMLTSGGITTGNVFLPKFR